MSFLFALIGFLITIGIIVTVHEGGHCFMAKALGVKVLRFSLGMGKVVWRRQIGETEYCLSLLPLGGYVKLLSEDDPDEKIAEADRPRAYGSQPRWKKALILFAGPAVNFVLAFVLYAAVGAIGTPDFAPVMGTPPAKTQAAAEGVREGDRVIAVDGVEIRGMFDLNFELTNRAGDADIPMTFARGSDIYVRHFSLADVSLDGLAEKSGVRRLGFIPFMRDPLVSAAKPDSPAALAGLKTGDRILAIDGVKMTSVEQVIQAIGAAQGRAMTMELENIASPGDKRTASVTPKLEGNRWLIGINITAMPEMVTVRLGPVDAVAAGWNKVKKITQMQVKGVTQMATGEASTKNLSGPIAIADMAGSAVKNGVVPFLEYLALISVAIGFMNLLPIPALDGGQLLIVGLEAVRRKDFSARAKENIGRAGIFLILLIFVFAMNNDITRLLAG